MGQCKTFDHSTATGIPVLSGREWDVLEYLADGYRPAAIAEEFGWQTTSISRYLLRIQNKIGARSSYHCLVRAFELGLLVVIDGQAQRNPDTI